MKKLFLIILVLPVLVPASLHAQTLVQDTVLTSKARVLSIEKQEDRIIPGTDVKTTYQTITVEILEGTEAGKTVTIENDYLNLKKGEVFYLQHVTNAVEGTDRYVVSDPYRMPTLYVFIGLFVLCALIFGGKQGARGLISLIASFAFIGYFLLPGIIHGYSPVFVSIVASSLIIILGSYVTHGFNRVTTTAVIGMIITILITGALAYTSIHTANLTGFATEEAVSLNLYTRGSIDFAGLLLGGMLIGLLGVLYDAAIGQAVAVDELRHVGPHLSRKVIFKRALRIGREHIGALVNTLAIAYVGASLPLLLLFYNSTANFGILVNQEIFATEIIRIMIGSIGLILAVPITTIIAVTMLVRKTNNTTVSPAVIADEMRITETLEHRH